MIPAQFGARAARRLRTLLHALCLMSTAFTLPSLAFGQSGIEQVQYEEVEVLDITKIDFSGYSAGHYAKVMPGFMVSFGERFAGQTVFSAEGPKGLPHDKIGFQKPDAPLTLLSGKSDQNVVIENDGDLGSRAILPVGPLGSGNKGGRGEGSLAIKFDKLQCAIGFRTFVDGGIYSRPQGRQPNVKVSFFTYDAGLIGTIPIERTEKGIYYFAFRQTGGMDPVISGLLIENMDREGIVLDDLIFAEDCVPALS